MRDGSAHKAGSEHEPGRQASNMPKENSRQGASAERDTSLLVQRTELCRFPAEQEPGSVPSSQLTCLPDLTGLLLASGSIL